MGIRVFIVEYEMERIKSVFSKTRYIGESLAIGMSHKFQSPDNRKVKLYFLSCSDPTVLAFQLLAYFTRATFRQVTTRQSVTS